MSEKDKSQTSGAAASGTPVVPSPRKKRILLVEDEPLTRLILLSKFRLAGLDVDVAWNGTLALEKLRAHQPDAMFLDLMLPDIKGVDVIKEARQDKVFSTRPIYVCTNAALMSVWSRRAFKAGATKVFNKGSTPVNDIVAEVSGDLLGVVAGSSESAGRLAPSEASAKVLEKVGQLCAAVEQISNCNDNEARVAKCVELRSKVQGVSSSAGAAGMHRLARVAATLEAFLKEICEKAKKVTDSCLNAIYSALEVMGQLCHTDPSPAGPEAESTGHTAVVVDSDLISRTAVGNALRNAGLKPITFGNPAQALEHLKSHPADLIIVDASVSEQAGLDLRNQVSEIQAHKETPVMVVATPRTVKRANRTPSKNATEFVAKPYTPMELSLKALSTVLRNRKPSKPAATPPTVPAAPHSVSAPVPGSSVPASATTGAPGTSDSRSTGAPARTQAEVVADVSSQLAGVPNVVFKKASSPQPESGQPAGADLQSSGGQEPVLEFNDAFLIVSANESCPAFFGWQIEELVGRELASVLKGGLNNDLGRFVGRGDAAARGSERPAVDVIVCRKEGGETPAAVTLEPLLQGSQLSWVATFRVSTGVRSTPPPSPGLPVEFQSSPGQSPALAEALRRLQHSQASLQSANEELHRQFEAISAQAVAQREEIERKEKERGELVARIYSNEVEIKRVKTTLEQESEERKKAEESLTALTTAKSEIEKQLTEEARSKEELVQSSGTLRGQIDEVKALADRAVAAQKLESDRAQQLEQELAGLKQTHGELNAKLTAEQEAVAESRRRNEELDNRAREQAAEIERVKGELEQQTAAWRQKESEFREQLATAKAATEKAEAAWMEESERTKQYQEQMQSFGNRLKLEESERTKQYEAELTALREQLNASKGAAEKAEAAQKEEAGRCMRLETELSSLRQEHDGLQAKCNAEQEAGAKAKHRVKELEKQFRDGAAGFTTAKAELEKRSAELHAEVSAAKTAAEQAGNAQQEEAKRRGKLEEQLATLRQEHEELSGKFSAGQQTIEESKRRVEELEKRLLESAAELGRAKAAVQSQTEMQARSAAALGSAEDFGLELCRLRENEAAHVAELSELERRVRDSVASLARVTAELEKERAERRRVEHRCAALGVQMQELHIELKQHLESEKATQSRLSDLEQQLHERGEAINRARAELHKETADRQLAEEQLRAAGDMSAQLRKYLSLFDESKKVFKRAQEDLEAKLQVSHAAVSEVEAKLQKEISERQRLDEALQAAQRNAQEQSEKTTIELAKLQSDLQVEQFERQRVQGDALQSRYASLDWTRAGRAHVTSFCRQIHQPVETVMQSTRRLLETDLTEPQKKLVEAVLENTLVVQTNLNESGSLASAPSRGGADATAETNTQRTAARSAEHPAGELQP